MEYSDKLVCLQICNGKPKTLQTRIFLQKACANAERLLVLLMGTQFHGETTMWDIVKDKLLAAVIILARTFPLHEALQGHEMADWIHEQHQLLHQDLANQKQNKDSITVNLNSDAESDDDNDRTYRKCHRCNRVRHEIRMYLCQKCHETWYCGQECCKRDAECHRNTCKQIQLKKKVNAKKAQASP